MYWVVVAMTGATGGWLFASLSAISGDGDSCSGSGGGPESRGIRDREAVARVRDDHAGSTRDVMDPRRVVGRFGSRYLVVGAGEGGREDRGNNRGVT